MTKTIYPLLKWWKRTISLTFTLESQVYFIKIKKESKMKLRDLELSELLNNITIGNPKVGLGIEPKGLGSDLSNLDFDDYNFGINITKLT